MNIKDPFMFADKWARFSPDGKYRYALGRIWGPTINDIFNGVLFIGLNPSTADAEKLDPTVRKCCIWAREWGFGHMMMGNVYAYRSTDPNNLNTAQDPIGPENMSSLISMAKTASLIVAAWGTKAKQEDYCTVLKNLSFKDIYCLGANKDGSPKHPLYLRMDTKPLIYVRKQ